MIYKFILDIVEPFIKWWGKLYFSFKKPQLTSFDYEIIRRTSQSCDIMLTISNGEFSNIFNPRGKDKFSHGAIYAGKEKVIEAVGKGVIETELVDFVLKHDAIIILRPTWLWHPEAKNTILGFAYDQKGKSYDYDFEDNDITSDNDFYCFELVANCYERAFPALKLTKKKILDGEFYVADSFLNGPFEVIYDSRRKDASRIH